tara:strand:+ start:209 stop:604 length:396 start_codon:yes stop_codon:yes gene_type:complete
MGYQIDVAFDMRIVGSMTNLYDMFVKKAEKTNCEMYYMNYEFDGIGRTIVRNHSVMTFIFPPEEEYIIKFIRFVREFRDARIESITTDDIKCSLIYASSKYLSMMDRGHAKTYKKSRHLLSTEQKSIINAM